MELRQYWNVLRRRWWLAVIPAAVVLTFGLATYRPPVPVYNAGVRFLVGQEPAPAAQSEDEERYYNWLTSEYIVNGLTDWVNSRSFATAVSQVLARDGHQVPALAIHPVADNTRSMLTLSVTGADTATVAAIMAAATEVLQEQNAAALPQLGGETAVVVQLDEPSVNQVPPGLRAQMDLPLRLMLALATGVGLALLAEYLDPTIQDRQAVTALGLTVLGELPRHK